MQLWKVNTFVSHWYIFPWEMIPKVWPEYILFLQYIFYNTVYGLPGIIGLTCMDLLSASPILLLTSAGSLFGNEIGRQGAVTPDTWKWDLDPHAGIEEEGWGVTGRVRQWKWRRVRGRRAEQQQLSEDWVTGQGRWPASKTPPRARVTKEEKHMSEYRAAAAKHHVSVS